MALRSIRAARVACYRALGALLLTAMVLAGCGTDGKAKGTSSTSCSLSQCTVTFQRGVDPRVQIAGIDVRLVGVSGDQATLDVAGRRVQLQVNQRIQVAGFQVSLQKLTEQEAVVRIARGGQNGGGGREGG